MFQVADETASKNHETVSLENVQVDEVTKRE